MSQIFQYGKFRIVFGVPPVIKEITGLPEGRCRLRLRNTDAAKVFIHTVNGIEKYALEDCGDTWKVRLDMRQGINRTLKNK